ncbi:MAG TPA: hypothetical protein VM074_06250 [Solimonas sp.]|nr:hypothetical protein [Solimonas sp.]
MQSAGRNRRRKGLVNRARRWVYGLMLGLSAHHAWADQGSTQVRNLGGMREMVRLPAALPEEALLVAPALTDFADTTVYGELLSRPPSRLLAEQAVLFAAPIEDTLLLLAEAHGWSFGTALRIGQPGDLDAPMLDLEPVLLAPFDGMLQLPLDLELVVRYGRWRGTPEKNASHERLPQATLTWHF